MKLFLPVVVALMLYPSASRVVAAPAPAKDSVQAPAVGAAEFNRYLIDEKTASRPARTDPVDTKLPLALRRGDRVVFIGNTLFERGADFPHFEAMLQAGHPQLELVVRTLAWSADEIDLMPRPKNFGDLAQHLTAQKADVIFAAFGFNESFGGVERLPQFRARLAAFLTELKTSAYNGKTAPRIVLVSPIANENVKGVPAADMNNARLAA